MKIRIFSLLAIGAMLVASGGFAQSVDLSFETTDTNLIQSPTFSGSTSGISAATVDNNSATEANDRLDTSFGDTAGTTSLETGFTFDVDTAFVRQTDANDRHLLTDDSQGIGLYIKYDGAAGPMEISVTLREDPVNTGNNEIYEVTTYKTLYGSQDWQYFYWDFATEILPTSSPDHWIPGLADGILDGGDGGDTFGFEAMHYRPIPGATALATAITTYVDDIHTGAAHTPTARANPIDYSAPFSISTVVVDTDITGVTSQTAVDFRHLGGGQGKVLYAYTNTAADPNAALVRIDLNGSSPVITSLFTEADFVAATPEVGDASIDLNSINILANGDMVVSDFLNTDEDILYIDDLTTITSLTTTDGIGGISLYDPNTLLISFIDDFGAAANSLSTMPGTGGAITPLLAEATVTGVTGATAVGFDTQAQVASDGTLIIWDEAFRGGSDQLIGAANDGSSASILQAIGAFDPTGFAGGITGSGIGSDDVLFLYNEFEATGGEEGLFLFEAAGTGARHIIADEALDTATGVNFTPGNNVAVHNEPDTTVAYLVDDNDSIIIAIEWRNVPPPPPAASTWNLYE